MLITCEVNLYHDIQFGHEVTSSHFCAVYNLAMKLLQGRLLSFK